MLSRPTKLQLGLLVLVAALAFSPALRGPQLFDDPAVIEENHSPALHPPAQSPVAGRPISNVSFAVNRAVNAALGVDQRPDPEGPSKTVSYHVLNLMLHLTSGLLLFGILRRTVQHIRPESGNADGVALVVTAVWLLHPLQTEAVDYLAQRTELLVSALALATLYASIRAWDVATESARRRWYAAGVATCLLGMGAKEVMVGVPLLVLLYDRAFRASSWREMLTASWRPRRWFFAGLFATLTWLAVLVAGNPRSTSAGFHAGIDSGSYLTTQGWAIAHYVRLLLWPVGFNLDYGMQPVELGRAAIGLLLVALLGVGTLVAWTRLPRWNWLAFAGAWFFVLLAPSSSFVPVATEIAAERRPYLAIAAVVLVLVVAVEWLARRYLPRRAMGIIAVAVIAVLAVLTSARSRLYTNPEAIWRDALIKNPDNPRAMVNLGTVLMKEPVPQVAEASALFRSAAERDSSYAAAWFNLAAIASTEHRYADEAALLRRVLDLNPRDQQALGALGHLALASNPATAIGYLNAAAAIRPDAAILVDLGKAQMAGGHSSEAEDAFRGAIAADSTRGEALELLGAMLTEQGHPDQASPYLEQALRLNPSSGMAMALLSLAEANNGHAARALELAGKASQLAPGDARVHFFGGRAILIAGTPELALAEFKRMADLGYRTADALDAMAMAEGRLGLIAEAAAHFREALRANPEDQVAKEGLKRLGR